jgi:hypothetical protein
MVGILAYFIINFIAKIANIIKTIAIINCRTNSAYFRPSSINDEPSKGLKAMGHTFKIIIIIDF